MSESIYIHIKEDPHDGPLDLNTVEGRLRVLPDYGPTCTMMIEFFCHVGSGEYNVEYLAEALGRSRSTKGVYQALNRLAFFGVCKFYPGLGADPLGTWQINRFVPIPATSRRHAHSSTG
jgi:hypothetical protein